MICSVARSVTKGLHYGTQNAQDAQITQKLHPRDEFVSNVRFEEPMLLRTLSALRLLRCVVLFQPATVFG